MPFFTAKNSATRRSFVVAVLWLLKPS